MGESNRFQMALMLCKAMIMFEKRCTLNTLALALTKKYVLYRIVLHCTSYAMLHSSLYVTVCMRIVRFCEFYTLHYTSVWRPCDPSSHVILRSLLLFVFQWRSQGRQHSVLCFWWQVALSAGRWNIPTPVYAANRLKGTQVRHVQYSVPLCTIFLWIWHDITTCSTVSTLRYGTVLCKTVHDSTVWLVQYGMTARPNGPSSELSYSTSKSCQLSPSYCALWFPSLQHSSITLCYTLLHHPVPLHYILFYCILCTQFNLEIASPTSSFHLICVCCYTSANVNEGGSDREVYEEMKRLYRLLGATVIQVMNPFNGEHTISLLFDAMPWLHCSCWCSCNVIN